jgi:TPR repeat protein
MYRFGYGVPQSLPDAIKWFRLAAEQGHAKAQCILGYCYTEGLGVCQNSSEAVRWLRLSAEKDYSEAQYLLALKYMMGIGVAKDMNEMCRWLKRASEWGEDRAQYNFGVALVTGQGIQQDLVQAHLWFSLVASQQHPDARAAVEKVGNMLSPDQKLKANELHESWRPLKRVRPVGMQDWVWMSLSPSEFGG